MQVGDAKILFYGSCHEISRTADHYFKPSYNQLLFFFRSEMFCLLLFRSHFLSLSCFLPMTPAPRTDLGDMFKEELCMIFLIWS